MIEQEEVLDFKALRAKFLKEDPLKLMNKPAIAQKPKVIPPPPSGTRVSLIDTINTAVENKMPFMPRVVFKDDKKQPPKLASKSKEKEAGVKPELINQKQKKEGDIVMQAMKDKKLPKLLPMLPVPVAAPEPESAPPPKPVKPPTAKKKGISIFKKPPKPQKVKTEAAQSTSPPSCPNPPSSGTAAPVVNTPVAQQALLPPIPVPAPTLVSSGAATPAPTPPVAQKPLMPPIPVITAPSSIPEPVIPEAAVSIPDVPPLDVVVPEISPPSIPEPEVPAPEDAALQIPDPEVPTPETSALSIPDLDGLSPEIHAPAIPDLDIPTPEIDVEAIPEPDIPTEIAPEVPEVPELEISVSDIPAPEMSKNNPVSDIAELDIPAPIIPPPEIPDFDAADPAISDPIIPDPTTQDADVTAPSIPDITSLDPPPPIMPASSIPVSDSLVISRTPSPEQVAPELSSSPLPSELPPAPVEFAEVEDVASEAKQESSSSASIEETSAEEPQCTTPPQLVTALSALERAEESSAEEPRCSTPPQLVTALSALERAEESAPERRTPSSDQRILNLLEKAKKKYAANKQANKTPSPSVSPVPPVSRTPTQADPTPPVSRTPTQADPTPPVSSTPTQADPTPPVSPAVSLPELPPVDYEEPVEDAWEQGRPATLVNGFDHRQVSPILEEPMMEEAQAEVPPAPPARKPLPAVPEKPLPAVPEKPPRPPVRNLSQLTSPIPVPQDDNEVVIPAPQDFSAEEPVLDPQNLSAVVPEYEDGSDIGTPELEILECGMSESSTVEEAGARETEHEIPEEGLGVLEENYAEADLGPPMAEVPEAEAAAFLDPTDSPVGQDAQTPTGPQDSPPEISDNIYEDVTTNKKKSKKKSPPKNPYADTQPAPEETHKSGWFKSRKSSVELAEEKEQKKKEKQREKEREKEREREKKEQKEREKKENEMKKKFKVTGQEEAMYEAKATVASKGKNNDLPVKSGDLVSIIRTTSCPKGKWLARDSTNTYGYVDVKSVELDITEMMELGKKGTAGRTNNNIHVDADTQHLDSGMSNNYDLTNETFSDDDDEWNDDDEHEPSPTELTDITDNGPYSMLSMAETMSPEPESPEQTLSDASTDNQHVQARHQALQKLATFFKQPSMSEDTTAEDDPIPEEEPSTEALLNNCFTEEAEPPVIPILPPPDLYADVITEEFLYTYSN